jgi:hypothetical protein
MSDYFLNKIYDSLLSKKPVPKKPEPIVEKKECSKPLSKVYEVLLREVEHVAIYGSKEDVDPKNIPDRSAQGLETLGVVSQEVAKRVKNSITASTVTPALESLMQKADEEGRGWHMPPVEGVSLQNVSEIFSQNNISAEAITYINEHKSSLTACEKAITTDSVNSFNLKQVTVQDLLSNKVPATAESLNSVYDTLFKMKAKVGLAAVGNGEIVTTLLTNAKKGRVGDLVFEDTKVEVKGIGGRLGKATFSVENTMKELANFLQKVQTNPVTGSKEALQNRAYLIKNYNKLKANEELIRSIKPEFMTMLAGIINNIQTPAKIEEVIKNSGFNLNASYNTVKQQYFTAPVANDNDIKLLHGYIRENVLKQKEPSNVNVFTPEELSRQTFTVGVQRFFLNDLQLTAEQAAQAFLFTKSRNINTDAYYPAILQYFKDNYESMKNGDQRSLEAILFGYLLTIYAKGDGSEQNFNYFLMINDLTSESCSVNVNGDVGSLVSKLAQAYKSNSKLSLDIKADDTHGASGVTFGPKPVKTRKK